MPSLGRVERGLAAVRALARRYEDVYWKQPRNNAVLERLRRAKADAVLASDLRALPIAVRLGPPVAFDAHEYAPRSSPPMVVACPPPAVRALAVRSATSRAVLMTTVSAGIAGEYERATGVR